jgi:hypothetical protein
MNHYSVTNGITHTKIQCSKFPTHSLDLLDSHPRIDLLSKDIPSPPPLDDPDLSSDPNPANITITSPNLRLGL